MSTEAVIAELLASKEPLRILVLGSEGDIKRLAALGLPVTSEDSSLSMQHLVNARLDAERRQGSASVVQVLTVMPETEQATAAECALIYAMLVRCRKVISCRDKLEDMLRSADCESWAAAKAAYETKVLDVFKATWREKDAYPYNIIDNIKEYNKNESYILKQLYWQLAERTPGRINDGDAQMINELRQMFSDISLSLLAPDIVLAGNIAGDEKLTAALELYKTKTKVIEVC